MNNYDGLKTLLYFAYGPLLKGYCTDNYNSEFTENVRRYLEGEYLLKSKILEDIYDELPHAVHELNDLAGEDKCNIFCIENVEKYIFEVHNLEAMSACEVKNGLVKSIDREKKVLEISRNGKTLQVDYVPSLEGTFKLGDKVYFHHGWLIKK
jgi:hypothetical protein